MLPLIKNLLGGGSKRKNSTKKQSPQKQQFQSPPPVDHLALQYSENQNQESPQRLTINPLKRMHSFKEEQTHEITSQTEQLIEYVVSDDDTLYGIALKFNIPIQLIQDINGISDTVFQGQIIKLPDVPCRSSLKRLSMRHQIQEGKTNYVGINIWNDIDPVYRFSMIYCTAKHNIEGTLTLTKDALLFDPRSMDGEGDLLKYNICISMKDINEAVYYVVPNKFDQKDYLVQILLSGIGRRDLEKKYRRKLSKYKLLKKSIATVFFRHSDRDNTGAIFTDDSKKETCIIISQFITDAAGDFKTKEIYEGQNYQSDFITKIPFLDLIQENLQMNKLKEDHETNDYVQEMLSERMDRLWTSIEYIPVLRETNSCLNNDQYVQIIEVIPAVFRLAKWYIKFDNIVDGSSFKSLQNKLKYECPVIFVLQTVDMEIFGAYMPVQLKLNSQGFYGNGETFLYHFNQTKLKAYHHTEKNENFIQSDFDGIGFGDEFGIYISSSLESGYSQPTQTFDSPQLSKNKNFKIRKLEVWAIELD